MSALLLAVFVASVLGSLHCAGMCGPLLACAVAPGGERESAEHRAVLGAGFGGAARWASWWPRFRPQLAYHLARLCSYVALGSAAGALGALLDLGGVLSGVQPVAAALAGAVMIVIGLAAITRGFATARTRLPLPKGWAAAASQAHATAMRLPPVPRAALIGLSTTLLPCGWLYAFAVTAAGTGSVGWGVAVMAVFWAGTLPVMVTLGAGLQGVLGFTGRRLPLATGLAMIVVGVVTLTQRFDLDPAALAAAAQRTTPVSAAAVPDPSATPACCALGSASAEGHADSGHDHAH